MLLNCGVGEDSWESLGLQGDPTSPSSRRSVLNVHWKDWCWSWNSNTLATWCEELIHWKRFWCWERLKAGGEGDDRGWDGWMASLTRWTWVEHALGVGDGKGSLACCSAWGHKESDMTEQLNWTELNWMLFRAKLGSFDYSENQHDCWQLESNSVRNFVQFLCFLRLKLLPLLMPSSYRPSGTHL